MCRKTFGYKKTCPICRVKFFICASCYRGHRYCGKECAGTARKETFKRATKLYQATPGVKEDIAAKQKEYRKRINCQALKSKDTKPDSPCIPSVTQHTSNPSFESLKDSKAGFLILPNLLISASASRGSFRSLCINCGIEIKYFRNSYG